MYTTTVSSQRQVTFSKDALNRMGINVGDRIFLNTSSQPPTIEKLPSISELAGSLKPFISKNKLNTPFEVAKKIAIQKMVEAKAHE